MASVYDKEFYDRIGGPSLRSARLVAPFLSDMFKPRSVIDFGCGTGSWLKAFSECAGVELIQGLEFGDFEDSNVHIDPNYIKKVDLTARYSPDRRFDMAVSLEVAEHIDEKFAPTFVENLVTASDIVLFSAAVPNQAGRNHVNLQFPSYWARLFSDYQYIVLDVVRPKFWNEENIEVWYRQNALVFVAENAIRENKIPASVLAHSNPPILDLIHPDMGGKFVSDLKARIAELHETYRNRLKEAKAEIWQKAEENFKQRKP